MKRECKIEIRENAQAYTISAPRTIPVPFKSQVKEASNNMQKKGIIVLVDHSTDWYVPIVVSIKKNSDAYICVNLSRLNKRLKRHFHPIPRVEL